MTKTSALEHRLDTLEVKVKAIEERERIKEEEEELISYGWKKEISYLGSMFWRAPKHIKGALRHCIATHEEAYKWQRDIFKREKAK